MLVLDAPKNAKVEGSLCGEVMSPLRSYSLGMTQSSQHVSVGNNERAIRLLTLETACFNLNWPVDTGRAERATALSAVHLINSNYKSPFCHYYYYLVKYSPGSPSCKKVVVVARYDANPFPVYMPFANWRTNVYYTTNEMFLCGFRACKYLLNVSIKRK